MWYCHKQVVLFLANVVWAFAMWPRPLTMKSTVIANQHISLPHFWPHARGNVHEYSTTRFVGPDDMNTTLAWSWHHPEGRYHTVIVGGALIDGSYGIYIASTDGIRKFSRNGEMLWYHKPPGDIVTCPSLWGDRLYGNSDAGYVFSLDLDTGREVWGKRFATQVGGDTAYVEAYNNVVVTGVDTGPSGGNTRMLGINSSSGELLWEFKPNNVVWNVMALFPDADSTIFMDYHGGVYRVGLHDGKLIWHTPAEGSLSSFSDGGVMLGPDGNAYTCSNPGSATGQEGQTGALRKYNYVDGTLMWDVPLPFPCNSWPVVAKKGDLVAVVPGSFNADAPTLTALNNGLKDPSEIEKFHEHMLQLGNEQRKHSGLPDLRGAVMYFATDSGKLVWEHYVEPYGRIAAMGDEEGVVDRIKLHTRSQCLPAHWSAPTMSSNYTVYVGRTDGNLYAFNPDWGERKFYTGSGPLHPGASFAPGMMAYTDCDGLFVWDVAETSRKNVPLVSDG